MLAASNKDATTVFLKFITGPRTLRLGHGHLARPLGDNGGYAVDGSQQENIIWVAHASLLLACVGDIFRTDVIRFSAGSAEKLRDSSTAACNPTQANSGLHGPPSIPGAFKKNAG